MKPTSMDKKNGYQSDDENVRYKINLNYFNNANKISKVQSILKTDENDEDIRYKFPTVLNRPKPNDKKQKAKIKVNFWSNKHTVNRLHNNDTLHKQKSNRRHTVGAVGGNDRKSSPKSKPVVKVRKQVSFLPPPLFSENQAPMVTVPDDLTIHLNEEEVNDIGEDLNLAFVNSISSGTQSHKKKSKYNAGNESPRGLKRHRGQSDTRGVAGENELEFFTKYVVQKLRRMETNQRIYSENLINTVLMLGQLGKLNGKSKIAAEA